MHNVLRRGTLFALCLLTAWAVRAAYPKHLQVTTPDGRTVTVTALDDNILKVSNTAPGEQPRIGTASVLTTGFFLQTLLAVLAFSCFWSILEVFEQRERVRKGWFPANPRRKQKS